MKNNVKIGLAIAIIVGAAGCSSFKAERVNDQNADQKAMGITDKWVDGDTNIVIDGAIKDIYAHKGFNDYLAQYQGKRIKLFVGEVQNNTSEAYFPIQDIEDALLDKLSDSEVFTLVAANKRDALLKEITYQNQGMVDPTQAKKIGKQSGADVIIFGEVNMKPETRGDKTIKTYSVNLYLTDIQSSNEVCRVREKINKYSENNGSKW